MVAKGKREGRKARLATMKQSKPWGRREKDAVKRQRDAESEAQIGGDRQREARAGQARGKREARDKQFKRETTEKRGKRKVTINREIG